MLPTINLDDHARFGATEIDDELVYGCLSSEFRAT